jgi:glycosyltransferase 2 family protein
MMKNILLTTAKTLVAVLLYYFIFRKVNFSESMTTLWNAQIWILLCSYGLLWVGHYICIFRWRMLMRPLMPVFSLTRLFEIYCIGVFFNLAFPTAVGGDVVKMYYAGKPSRKYAESFAATFLDRDSGMLAMMMIACVGTWYLPTVLPGLPVRLIVWLSFAAFVALNIAIFVPSLHRLVTKVLHRLRLARIANKVDTISNAFQIMGKNPRVLLLSLAISLGNQFLVIFTTWVSAVALHVRVPFLYFLVFVPVITLITMIPITPSGSGLRESAFLTLFGSIGVAPAAALALALISLIMLIGSAIPGGIIYTFFGNRSDLKQMASMDDDFS